MLLLIVFERINTGNYPRKPAKRGPDRSVPASRSQGGMQEKGRKATTQPLPATKGAPKHAAPAVAAETPARLVEREMTKVWHDRLVRFFPEACSGYGRSSDFPRSVGLPVPRARISGWYRDRSLVPTLQPAEDLQQRVLSRIFTGFPFHPDRKPFSCQEP